MTATRRSGGSPGRDIQSVEDLIAFVRQRVVDDIVTAAQNRAVARARRVAGLPALPTVDLDRQNNLLNSAMDAYEAGADQGGERLRQLTFEAYGTREDYLEEWRPAVREEAPPECGGNVTQAPGTPRDAFAELDELRKRVERLERLLAVHVPA